jgi:hypothetical protein
MKEGDGVVEVDFHKACKWIADWSKLDKWQNQMITSEAKSAINQYTQNDWLPMWGMMTRPLTLSAWKSIELKPTKTFH